MEVAVVGAGWSGLAAATFLREAGARVRVLEAATRVGGRAATLREEGYLLEAGPHAVQPRADATRRLMDLAGIPFVEAPPRAPRLVVRDGRPVPLPTSPPALLATPLLTAGAKARLLLEPTKGRGPEGETVAAFARRRLGEDVAPLVDAFVTGVHAGDPARLAVAHAFPALARMDREGGLLRSMLRARGARPPPLQAPREGMQAWLDALARPLDVRVGAPVRRVREEDGRAWVDDAPFDAALVALDPPAAARMLGIAAPTPPVAPVSIVGFGVAEDVAPREGYGVLAPEAEGRFVLGALYESALFPGRAPPGHALVRALVGGRRHPERAALPDDELARRAWDDLRGLGVVRGEPSWTRVLRTPGIPQLEVGHDAWLDALPAAGRVRVLGIGHRAVGLDALAAEAARAVDALVGLLRGAHAPTSRPQP